MKKKVSIMLLVVCLLALIPVSAYAKGRGKTKKVKVYKDVTSKTVDSESLAAIQFVKDYDGWKGLVRKNKFFPNRKMTRREFLICIHNLYGNVVTANMEDLLLADQYVTSNYVCDKFVSLSKPLGCEIRWTGHERVLMRKDVARYIRIFATYNPRLMPRK